MALTPPEREPDATAIVDDPCAPQRRVVEEACALVERLGAMLETTRADLRTAQSALAVHEDRQARAARDADPREIHRRKEEAFTEFRSARAGATGRGDLETAAAAWLREIDEVNRRLIDARRVLETETPAVGGLVADMEKKTVAVDRARVAAEQAAAACHEAREHLAACEEASLGPAAPRLAGAAPAVVAVTTGTEGASAAGGGPEGTDRDLEEDAAWTGPVVRPRIVAILAGDSAERDVVAVALGGGEPSAADRWAALLDDLAAAIVERAIEESRFMFPRDHPFWGMFLADECREISVALAALGYRPVPGDGWADGRVPGRRDLSLAVGFASQDPMRIRIWPTEAEMARLFDGTSADVVGFLFETAGDLTLGQMVALLGRRAEAMTALWNVWGRARPLLLAETA